MSRVANGNAETVSSCCPPSQQDPVALRVCALSSYMKGGRNDVASFLASVPADKASAHSLWLLDEIAHSQGPGAGDGTPRRGGTGDEDEAGPNQSCRYASAQRAKKPFFSDAVGCGASGGGFSGCCPKARADPNPMTAMRTKTFGLRRE